MDLETLKVKADLCEKIGQANESIAASYAQEVQLIFAHPKMTLMLFQDEHATSRLFKGIADLLKKEHKLLMKELNIERVKDDASS